MTAPRRRQRPHGQQPCVHGSGCFRARAGDGILPELAVPGTSEPVRGTGDFIQTYAGTMPLLLCLDDEVSSTPLRTSAPTGRPDLPARVRQREQVRLPVSQLGVQQSRRSHGGSPPAFTGIRQVALEPAGKPRAFRPTGI